MKVIVAEIATSEKPQGSKSPQKQFRPVNTLSSPKKPKFHTGESQGDLLLGEDVLWPELQGWNDDENFAKPLFQKKFVLPIHRMVRARSPSGTSSAQHNTPPHQPQPRQPLANISAKMQSNSPKQDKDTPVEKAMNPIIQPEFGKSSPLRNPLKKDTNIFIPRNKPKPLLNPMTSQNRPYLPQNPQQARPGVAPLPHSQSQGFYKPGQPRPTQPPADSTAALQSFFDDTQPYKPASQVHQPGNVPLRTVKPAPRPKFSSLGPNTTYQAFVPPKPIVDLTKTDDDEDEFDPDAEIRANGGKFGDVDPFMYMDSAKANDNIKNLLEAAFDDDENKGRTRLRSRAKKAIEERNQKEAQSLVDKLSSLTVKEDEKAKPQDEEDEEEEEDGSVEGLVIKLLPHQVDGVSWMIDKEIGVRKKKGVLPNGGILADDMGLGKTVQSVALILTNSRPGPDAKPEHPKQVFPGSEVGKGTLVVAPLALIKQWEDEIKTKVTKSHALRVLVHHGPSRTKLGAELKKYDVVITTYQTLTSEHAGSNMTSATGARVGCFGVYWYRVILDEAHSIKNRNAKSTLACCALNSWYRWCLTGTPMQNNLDELQSLIKFLRIKPYCDIGEWKSAITNPMKNGRGGLAMRRLQFFLKAFMKRRTKDILKKEGALNFGGKEEKEGEKKPGMQIVKREVFTVECDFDPVEQDFYTRLQERADKRLKQLSEDAHVDYMGALVLLLRLRQVCDHPALIEKAVNNDNDALTTGLDASQTPRKQSKAVADDEMDDLAALMGGVTVKATNCDICQFDLSTVEIKKGSLRCSECEESLAALNGKKPQPKMEEQKRSRNRRVVLDDSDEEDEGEWIADGSEQQISLGKAGGSDDEDAEGGGETLATIDSDRSVDDDEDEDSPPRAMIRKRVVKTESDDEDDTDESSASSAEDLESDPKAGIFAGFQNDGKQKHKPSTKIRHLLRILHTEIPEHKTIVFSQFTTMLDLIQPHLNASGIRYVRYDGSMRNDAREAALHSLRTDPKTRVLLCSLKCGSLGLNLTVASRVVILEPFWNPFVEEQAIDRVHRLNQTVDVKVFRLTIRNTVEERILALQERKRELAKAAIEGGKAVGKLSMKDIMSLFQRDAEHGEQDKEDKKMWQKFGGDQRLFDGASSGLPTSKENAGTTSHRSLPPKKGRAKVVEHSVYGRRW
ncbi:Hypothetical protein R9X50_00357800 [Acrodontium crateriforme]|uniref:Uncharacterized protein n=1 Tax=Acrodontium crateriforme TaxID=150365 RepID=A0AAQ3RBZ1_9PEZI|nr:Hypothetical protein R9X50_00357800 [Acrodontium crateriforme]